MGFEEYEAVKGVHNVKREFEDSRGGNCCPVASTISYSPLETVADITAGWKVHIYHLSIPKHTSQIQL